MISFSAIVITLLSPDGQRVVYSAVVTAAVVCLFFMAWLLRILWYRSACHNTTFYQQLVDYEQQRWWVQHRQALGLQDIILLGPSGCDPLHWYALLNREHPVPQPGQESSGKALRLPQIVGKSQGSREEQLARALVIQWREQRSETLKFSPCQCLWLGSLDAWQAFSRQAAISFPELSLPAFPERWEGELTLSSVIERVASASSEEITLIAGCQSQLVKEGDVLPAGEAAMLWLAGQGGHVQITRGEVCESGDAGVLSAACQRALQQANIVQPPDACMLFTLPGHDMPSIDGWNLTHHLQDRNWGHLGEMESLIVMSLAALYTQQQSEPCGWVARDLSGGYTTGIVKVYG